MKRRPSCYVTRHKFESTGFESLGCWKDAWARALPTLEGDHYLLMEPNYKSRTHALFKCARAAHEKKLKVFGLENGGQCFGSTSLDARFKKYGPAKECRGKTGWLKLHLMGGLWCVYQFKLEIFAVAREVWVKENLWDIFKLSTIRFP